jgi:prepilin-type N-terminal cleavage/methylation domain-containing protein
MRRNAFTIPEFLIGLAILAFILMFAFSLLTSGLSQVTRTRDYSVAVMLTTQLMEASRAYPFDYLDEDGPDPKDAAQKVGKNSLEWDVNHDDPGDPQNLFEHEITLDGVKYTKTLEVDAIPNANPPNLPPSIPPRPFSLKSIKAKTVFINEKGKRLEYVAESLVTRTGR